MDKENVAYIHNGVLCIKKKNEIMSLAGKWIELESIIRKINQIQKDKYHVFLSCAESEGKKKT
jgi:hypothetical protein